MMNAKTFESKTGHIPEHDDLERVNCKDAGEVFHFSCGWCSVCDLPRFQCPHGIPFNSFIRRELQK